MTVEIERRFLVPGGAAALRKLWVGEGTRLRQGYFGRVGRFRLRVRSTITATGACTGVLTLKSSRRGLMREEHEIPMGFDLAEIVLGCLPLPQIIHKTRYHLRDGDNLLWSIDLFEGPNEGLVIAEVELPSIECKVVLPPWVGREVTFDRRYGNSTLAQSPIPAAFTRCQHQGKRTISRQMNGGRNVVGKWTALPFTLSARQR